MNPLIRTTMHVLAPLCLGGLVASTPFAQPVQESAASRLAATKVDKDQLQFNLDSVEKLLTASSAARQIESSRAPEATSRRDRAIEVHKRAREAMAAGDLQRASALLTESRSVFFDAVRLAAPEEVTAKKLEADYKARLESVQALLAAFQRVASEKPGVARGVRETVAEIEGNIGAAARMAQNGHYREGRQELDRAYLVAKAGISGLRSGETLVRSLNFASKEEEFHYEVDRNNTHQMLIKVLVDERKAADGMIRDFINRALELRTRAEASATRKDYATAVKELEDSTAELVRAIRNAGVYIPG